ncbi:beta-glycosyltransferase [Clostridium polyendosporum]|uniref:Beta-glycosyltransferase n=1 Tax=Clostridium polyendosporum TaxID=69208 RepID=A0A919RYD3_9CLOT|nr:glycosyltransferase family 2 protein [Clostridium polyendosporum]GIM28752.1 beta-glycosyltransferase [Clostridium polyendosporum]
MLRKLTIFTPTYNRGYTLHLCYESLKRQTCKDFVWLIIDDGSTDNTKELVEKWRSENIVDIHYYYQENQGMHGAHNAAYRLIDTELNVCIDSDDFMADDAVEKIINFWNLNGNERYAGIVALNAKRNGTILGTALPKGIRSSKLWELYTRFNVKGDKKLIYRSELTRKYPSYPIFTEEKYVPLSYKYIMIDQEYELLLMNEIVCYVEYLEDGSSLNIFNQYRKNPKGFIVFRKVAMKLAPNFKEKFRNCVHYVSSNLMIKNINFLKESPCKFTTLLALPLGTILYFYIKKTSKKVYKNLKLQ